MLGIKPRAFMCARQVHHQMSHISNTEFLVLCFRVGLLKPWAPGGRARGGGWLWALQSSLKQVKPNAREFSRDKIPFLCP